MQVVQNVLLVVTKIVLEKELAKHVEPEHGTIIQVQNYKQHVRNVVLENIQQQREQYRKTFAMIVVLEKLVQP